MSKQPPDYLSYLLRLWRVGGEAETWRASLESSLTHEIERFSSLDQLLDLLRCRTGIVPGSEEDGCEAEGGCAGSK